ncbi:hypothetical protein SCHPADRAFT_893403 [Schizopora paradoxa]|uniref:Uncharacterized protein n=1 Tax=Schizopora paradoxa TaxID=27342 RepID=A0A0H2RB10_9AGAM|nr:hypothetical protein SCHPADRAFT_893403 [Schizopora paradoxa]
MVLSTGGPGPGSSDPRPTTPEGTEVYRSLEELSRISMALKEKSDVDAASLSDEINSTLKKIASGLTALDKTAAARDTKIMHLLERFADHQKLQDNTIQGLLEHIRHLEFSLKIHQIPATILETRNHLDFPRVYFVQALRLCFPKHFPQKDVINQLDPLGLSVVWYKLKEAMTTHYNNHFENGMQVATVFASLDVHSVTGERNTHDNFSVFKKIPVYDVSITKPSPFLFEDSVPNHPEFVDANNKLEDESSLYVMFKFYIPVFIWAYNTVKLVIEEDDIAIRILDAMLAAKDGNLVISDIFPDYSHFDVGSGLTLLTTEEFFSNRFPILQQHAADKSQNKLPRQIPVPETPPYFHSPIIAPQTRGSPSYGYVSPGGTLYVDNRGEKRPYEEEFNASAERVEEILSLDLNATDGGNGIAHEQTADEAEARSRKKRALGSGKRPASKSPPTQSTPTHHASPPKTSGKRKDSVGTQQSVSVVNIREDVFLTTVEDAKAKAQARRERHIETYNTLLRCLSILLDDELIKLALLKSSPSRVILSNKTHHFRLHVQEMSKEAIDRFGDVAKTFEAPPALKMTKEEIVGKAMSPAVVASRDQLRKLFQEDNATLAEAQTVTEKAVDLYLYSEFLNLKPRLLSTTMNDYLVLMAYLTDLHTEESADEEEQSGPSADGSVRQATMGAQVSGIPQAAPSGIPQAAPSGIPQAAPSGIPQAAPGYSAPTQGHAGASGTWQGQTSSRLPSGSAPFYGGKRLRKRASSKVGVCRRITCVACRDHQVHVHDLSTTTTSKLLAQNSPSSHRASATMAPGTPSSKLNQVTTTKIVWSPGGTRYLTTSRPRPPISLSTDAIAPRRFCCRYIIIFIAIATYLAITLDSGTKEIANAGTGLWESHSLEMKGISKDKWTKFGLKHLC